MLATALPPELRDRATSLETELGRAIDRHQLLAETLAALSRRYEDLLAGRFDAILDAWRRLAPAAMNARVEWTTNAGTAAGVTAGIDDRLQQRSLERQHRHAVGRRALGKDRDDVAARERRGGLAVDGARMPPPRPLDVERTHARR